MIPDNIMVPKRGLEPPINIEIIRYFNHLAQPLHNSLIKTT